MTIAELIAAHAPAHALDQAFYVDDAVFARDIDLLLGRWTCVGHASEIPEAGDYFVTTLGLESAIVVRGADGEAG